MDINKEEAKFLYGLMDAVFHFAHVASVEHVEALTHNIPKMGLHKTMALFNKLKGDIDENQ